MSKLEHIGSSFDDFLEEEGIKTEVSVSAIKRTLAWKVQQDMEKQGLSKTQMAEKLETSRSGLDRLLDSENTSITLHTIERAATKLGIEIQVTITQTEQSHSVVTN